MWFIVLDPLRVNKPAGTEYEQEKYRAGNRDQHELFVLAEIGHEARPLFRFRPVRCGFLFVFFRRVGLLRIAARALCVSVSSVDQTAGVCVCGGAGVVSRVGVVPVEMTVGMVANVPELPGVERSVPPIVGTPVIAADEDQREAVMLPATAGESVGISRSDGARSAWTSSLPTPPSLPPACGTRLSGFFAIIFSTTATIESGTFGRSILIGRGGRFWCQINFWRPSRPGMAGNPASR